jgi:hypothetical protein
MHNGKSQKIFCLYCRALTPSLPMNGYRVDSKLIKWSMCSQINKKKFLCSTGSGTLHKTLCFSKNHMKKNYQRGTQKFRYSNVSFKKTVTMCKKNVKSTKICAACITDWVSWWHLKFLDTRQRVSVCSWAVKQWEYMPEETWELHHTCNK